MMINILIALGLGGLLSLGGVALGAVIVFRTKREPHERLFGGVPKGEVFSVDDLGFDAEKEEEAWQPPESIQKRSEEFVNQFAEGLGNEKS